MIEQLPSLPLLALALAIVVFASTLQASVGMGFGMVAAPLLALIDPLLSPVPIMMVGIVVAVWGAWRERGNIAGAEIVAGVGGRVIGSSLAFLLLLVFSDESSFYLLFGGLTLVAVLLTALGKPVAFTLANHWALSTLSGLMGTITSVGAPPMAILYRGQRPDKVRPTLNALFFTGCVVGLTSLGLAGRLAAIHLVLSAIILPGVLAGIWLARYFRTDSASRLSAVMLTVSGAAAAVLILKGLNVFS
ncbi:MAG: sulfite exporter TauE/SafE family protein [Phyllobacteriaceae bacterium]|nr:sulfite exporter TauE/SafE family protein [Nitratireductor sp.]MCO5134901.1 sulfite exporter TauE/SafE family protein [Phyllobacteriaceae bacterium]